MVEILKKILSVITGLFTSFFSLYGAILGLVGFAIIFDTITGVAASKAKGVVISSKKANQGFWKKVGLLLALFFGVFLDVFIHFALSYIPIPVQYSGMIFGMIFGCYIIFNESISVCENLDKINPDILPGWVKKMLQGGAGNIQNMVTEKEVESNDGK